MLESNFQPSIITRP